MKKVQVIEDDLVLREELKILLMNSGYEVSVIDDFTDTAKQMEQSDADLILLDINLPGMNGEALLQEFRKKREIPVIILTSRTSEMDEVLCLSYGADDYITKPYNPTILLLHISAVLKRSGKISEEMVYCGIEVSLVKGTLRKGDMEVILTKNEMIIFQMLFERKGQIVTRDDLMTALWDNDEFVNDNALSVNISRLRSKLEEFGLNNPIDTRRKQGYVLNENA